MSGRFFEAYISNGIDMDFLKSGTVCFLREAKNGNRRTLFDLYSVYDGDALVCVDAKEPLRIAEIWASNKLNREVGREFSFYANVKGMNLLALNRENHDLMIQVMGTSFVNNGAAYLPKIPSKALNDRIRVAPMDEGSGAGPTPAICRLPG